MRKLLILVLSLFIFYSCGKNEQKIDEKKDTQTEVNSNNTSGEKKKDGNDTQKSAGNELGMITGLPSDFPKDVPQPPNSTCVGSLVNQTEGTTVTFTSKAKVLEIADFYKSEMKKNNYQIEAGQEDLLNDKGGMIKWNKPEKEVEIMMSFNSDQKSTDIVLSYKNKK